MMLPIIVASFLLLIIMTCFGVCVTCAVQRSEEVKKALEKSEATSDLGFDLVFGFVFPGALIVMFCLCTNVMSIFFTSYHPYGKDGSPIPVWMVCRDLLARLDLVFLLP